MNNIVEVVPGQVMEFCLMHNPNIFLKRMDVDADRMSLCKKGDKYVLSVANQLIDITDSFDHEVLDDIIAEKFNPLYYDYRIFDTEYVLISELNNSDPISMTQSFIDIIHQAYAIYVNYLKIESVDDAMEYFCRSILTYNENADDEIIPIPLDENGKTANAAWARLSSMVQFPLLMHTDL